MSVIIFDLDGTLADIRHRLHFIKNDNKQWDDFFAACVDDILNAPVAEIWYALQESGLHDLWIFSGRSDQVRAETIKWLNDREIYPNRLYMRTAGDHRPDDKLKLEWLNSLSDDKRLEILCVFDDRQRLVDMWRANGIACLQVAEGNF